MDEGTISICEEDVVKQREKALSYVSCMIEGPGLFENMTGKENLELMATLNHASKEKLHEMMEFTQIGSQLKTKAVSQYSMGMKQRTGLAVALMKEPKVLLLDEPMNGLDATGIQGLREELIRLAKEKNVALLISSHQLGEIEKMADRIIGIHFGKIKEISMEEKENVYVLETDRKIPDQSDLQNHRGRAADGRRQLLSGRRTDPDSDAAERQGQGCQHDLPGIQPGSLSEGL